eukprot:g55811.t1
MATRPCTWPCATVTSPPQRCWWLRAATSPPETSLQSACSGEQERGPVFGLRKRWAVLARGKARVRHHAAEGQGTDAWQEGALTSVALSRLLLPAAVSSPRSALETTCLTCQQQQQQRCVWSSAHAHRPAGSSAPIALARPAAAATAAADSARHCAAATSRTTAQGMCWQRRRSAAQAAVTFAASSSSLAVFGLLRERARRAVCCTLCARAKQQRLRNRRVPTESGSCSAVLPYYTQQTRPGRRGPECLHSGQRRAVASLREGPQSD